MITSSRFDFAESTRTPLGPKLRDVLADCGQRSTIHAVPSLAAPGASTAVKCLWAGSFCVCLLWLGWLMRALVADFLDYRAATLITHGTDRAPPMPTIAFCNLNAFDPSSGLAMLAYLKSLQTRTPNPTAPQSKDATVARLRAQLRVLMRSNADTYLRKFGFSLTRMLVSCRYRGFPCGPDAFEPLYDATYGNCFRLDEARLRQKLALSVGGSDGHGADDSVAFRLELSTGYTDQLQELAYRNGVRLVVVEPGRVVSAAQEGLNIDAGRATSVRVARRVYKRLPAPYGACLSELDASSPPLAFLLEHQQRQSPNSASPVTYQRSSCLTACSQMYVYKWCHCYTDEAGLGLNRTAPSCMLVEELDCALRALRLYQRAAEARQCTSACPDECREVRYELRPVRTQLRARSTRNDSSSNRLVLDLVLEPDFAVVEDVPLTPFDVLVANAGGLVGLLTGAGLLSFVELFDLLVSLLFTAIEHYKRSQPVSP